MALNLGSAVAYLELDSSGFTKGFKSAAKELEAFNKKSSTFSSKLKGVSKAVGTVGSTLTKSVSVPLAGAGTALSAFAMTAQKATNKITTYFGDTGEQAEKNAKIIKDVFSSGIPESMEEAADAIIEVREQLGELSDTDLSTISKEVLTLEKTFGSDMSETLRGVNSLMENFGMTATEAMDYVVAGTQRGLDKTNELGDNLAEYGQLWSQAGFSAQEMFTILENGLDSGAYNLDKVNDFVKEFTISLSDGRIEESINSFSEGTQRLFNEYKNGEATASEVFYSVINDLETTMSKQEALTVASNTWSALGEDNALQVISALNDVGTAYDDVNGKAQEMVENQTSGASGAIAELKNNAQILASEIGESLVPNVEKLNEFVLNITEAFRGMSEEEKQLAVNIGTIVVAIGPLLLIISKVIGIISAISKALSMLGKITGITKLFSGIAEVIALVAGGAGTLGEALTAVFPILGTIGSVFSSIGSAIGTVVSAIGTFVAGLNPIVLVIAGIIAAITGLVVAIKTNFLGIGDLFQSLVDTVVGFFTETIPEAFENFISFISEIPDRIGEFVGSIGEFFSGIGETIAETFTGIVETVLTFFTETIPNAISNFVDTVITFFQELPYNLGFVIGQMLGHLYVFASDCINWAMTAIPQIIDAVITFFSQLPGKIWNVLTQAFSRLVEWGANMISKAIEIGSNFLSNIINFFVQLPGNILNFLTSAFNFAVSWGGQMISKAIEVGSNFLSSVVNFFVQLPGRIWSFLTSTFQKVISWGSQMISKAKEVASNFLNNFVNFIKDLPGKVWNIVKQIPDKIMDIGQMMFDAGADILQSLWDGLMSIGDKLLGWVGDLAGKIGDFVGGIIDGFQSVVSGADKAKSAAQSVDGSHAGGLDYVPYNGYIAELHEGERVLTKQQNEDYNRGITSGGDVFNFYKPIDTPYEHAREIKRAKRELLAGV